MDTNFEQARCLQADFRFAKFSNVQFWQADVKGANFNKASMNSVNFSLANLGKADLSGTGITERQLWSALSIQDAHLSNGTYARDPNLVENGQAHCNISLLTSWKLQTGDVRVVLFDKNTSNCHFALKSHTKGAIMWQCIDPPNLSKLHLYPNSKLVLSARMSVGVSIQLSGRTLTERIVARNNLSKCWCYSNQIIGYVLYAGSVDKTTHLNLIDDI